MNQNAFQPIHPFVPQFTQMSNISVADPGFPPWGAWTLWGGGVDSRGGYVSKILYVKTKESGPLGGGVRRASANVDPPMHLKVIIVFK